MQVEHRHLIEGLRQFVRRLGTSVAGTLALAFGIGLVTLAFSIANALLLRPLPFEQSDRLYVLERRNRQTNDRGPDFSVAEWPQVAPAVESFAPLGACSFHDQCRLGESAASSRAYRTSVSSANLLEVLRIAPMLGRCMLPEEDQPGSPRVVVLSYRAWQRDFGGDASVVGLAPDLKLGGILGEMHEGRGYYLSHAQHPLSHMTLCVRFRGGVASLRGRLRAGAWSFGLGTPPYSIGLLSDGMARASEVIRVFAGLFLIFGLAALLLAAIGITSLLSLSVTQRTRELGVRMALGATRGGVVALVLRSALVRMGIGLALGLALTWGASNLAASFVFVAVPPSDPVVVVLVLASRLGAGLPAVSAPALRAARLRPLEALRCE